MFRQIPHGPFWLYPELTFHGEDDGLTGLVLSVLVIDGLSVVTARVRGNRRENDQRVVQSESSEDWKRGQKLGKTTTGITSINNLQHEENRARTAGRDGYAICIEDSSG